MYIPNPSLYFQFVGFDYRSNSPLQTLPPGANIFGILPGKLWGTSRDRVVIIGAHWDTMTETDGYNDNGSGWLVFEYVVHKIQ